MRQIAVCIVNYNTCGALRECLETVIPQAPAELLVADNASLDNSVEMMRTEFPNVTLYRNSVNRGYGGAANQAIARCSSQHVCLLNSDTLLEPGALQALSEYLDQNRQVAIAGPRILNRNRNPMTPAPTPPSNNVNGDTFTMVCSTR